MSAPCSRISARTSFTRGANSSTRWAADTRDLRVAFNGSRTQRDPSGGHGVDKLLSNLTSEAELRAGSTNVSAASINSPLVGSNARYIVDAPNAARIDCDAAAYSVSVRSYGDSPCRSASRR